MQAETADDVTLFRGAVVPAQKECLLMIDLESGVGSVCVCVCVCVRGKCSVKGITTTVGGSS